MIWIRSFDDVGMVNIASVGGKNASLGEMRRALTPVGIRTPDGFATTADAYRAFLRGGDLEGILRRTLADLDITDIDALQGAGVRIRSAILAAPLPTGLIEAVRDGYRVKAERAIDKSAAEGGATSRLPGEAQASTRQPVMAETNR